MALFHLKTVEHISDFGQYRAGKRHEHWLSRLCLLDAIEFESKPELAESVVV